MRALNQIIAVTALNLKNLPQRSGSSLVAIIGVAAVVLVFAAVLSMAKGFERTMVTTGSEDTAIIMPTLPPIMPPANTNNTISIASSKPVFTLFINRNITTSFRG